MNSTDLRPNQSALGPRQPGWWLLCLTGAIVVIVALLTFRQNNAPHVPTARDVVAQRLKLFSSQQRAVVEQLAARDGLLEPAGVKRLFNAMDKGDWPKVQSLFKTLASDRSGSKSKVGPFKRLWQSFLERILPPNMRPSAQAGALRRLWRPIQEVYGAADQVQAWPPQQLLDYGNAILDSLPSNAVYFGGTDAGCFICAMLNATSQGPHRLVLTQNALADNNYLAYLRAIGDGGLHMLTDADAAAAFNEYLVDAQKRLQHDQQFPGEPKQVRRGEIIAVSAGRTSISGIPAIMAINGILLQKLMSLNPARSFALEESTPLPESSVRAVPLGPIFRLEPAGDKSEITSEAANQVVNYWRHSARALAAGADSPLSPIAQAAWAHDALAQANLLADHHHPAQAAQTYSSALAIFPGCFDAISGLTKLLMGQDRPGDAAKALDAYLDNNPSQGPALEGLRKAVLETNR